MKYYRVRPEADGVRRYKWGKHGYIEPFGEFVRNELITERELQNEVYHNKTKDQIMETVKVSKREIYYFFGARFQYGRGYQDA